MSFPSYLNNDSIKKDPVSGNWKCNRIQPFNQCAPVWALKCYVFKYQSMWYFWMEIQICFCFTVDSYNIFSLGDCHSLSLFSRFIYDKAFNSYSTILKWVLQVTSVLPFIYLFVIDLWIVIMFSYYEFSCYWHLETIFDTDINVCFSWSHS